MRLVTRNRVNRSDLRSMCERTRFIIGRLLVMGIGLVILTILFGRSRLISLLLVSVRTLILLLIFIVNVIRIRLL